MKGLILDIDSRHSVREDGVVLRDGKVLNTWLSTAGYPTFKIDGKNIRVHRAVAEAFIPRVEGKPDVNHVDGNKTNNHVSNLEWCTRGENAIHALRNGLHSNAETPIVGYNEDTGEGYWLISQALSKSYGFSQPNVAHCLAGRRAKCKGFKWEYA